jgi:uncharacterized protein YjiS (DUF1127 family)
MEMIIAGKARASVPGGDTRGDARGGAWRRLWRLLALWRQRSTERALLASMDERQLKDLGLSPDSVRAELAKRLWVP